MTTPKTKKTSAKRAPRKKPEAFPVVTEEVPYGVDQNKRPVLYELLAPLAMEANDHGGVTPWRATKGRSVSQIRSAAAAWGYRVNVSTTVSGEVVFRLNGLLPTVQSAGN